MSVFFMALRPCLGFSGISIIISSNGPAHYETIEKVYSRVAHRLYRVGVSNEDQFAKMTSRSIDGSGDVSHSDTLPSIGGCPDLSASRSRGSMA